MPAKTILSRPVYGTLSPQTGKNHLLVADAEGASAILDLAKKAPEGFFASAPGSAVLAAATQEC